MILQKILDFFRYLLTKLGFINREKQITPSQPYQRLPESNTPPHPPAPKAPPIQYDEVDQPNVSSRGLSDMTTVEVRKDPETDERKVKVKTAKVKRKPSKPSEESKIDLLTKGKSPIKTPTGQEVSVPKSKRKKVKLKKSPNSTPKVSEKPVKTEKKPVDSNVDQSGKVRQTFDPVVPQAHNNLKATYKCSSCGYEHTVFMKTVRTSPIEKISAPCPSCSVRDSLVLQKS